METGWKERLRGAVGVKVLVSHILYSGNLRKFLFPVHKIQLSSDPFCLVRHQECEDPGEQIRTVLLMTSFLSLSSWSECIPVFAFRHGQPGPPHGPQQPLYRSPNDDEQRNYSNSGVPRCQHSDLDWPKGSWVGSAAPFNSSLPKPGISPPHGRNHRSLHHCLLQGR